MIKTPFLNDLFNRCHGSQGRIVFAEGGDDRTIAAAKQLLEAQLFSKIILLGTAQDIEQKLDPVMKSHRDRTLIIIDQQDRGLREQTTTRFCDVVRGKGRIPNPALMTDVASDPLFQAGTILHAGDVDCAVAGAVAPTAQVIRAALNTIGLANKTKTVSGSFMMDRNRTGLSETYCYADAGVVIDPSIEQLSDIAISSCKTWLSLMRTPPVVAFLSFSTKGSAAHALSEKMAQACDLFKRQYPGIEADGELQFDAAFVESVGRRKAPGSKVCGRANVFIFPDLNAGNIAYKITQRLGDFGAYGPILQGLALPYSDLSRGATCDDIVVSAVLNRVRAL